MNSFMVSNTGQAGTISILLFLFMVTGAPQLFSQKSWPRNLNLTVNLHGGYNLPLYPFFTSITEDYVKSVDISLYKETSGKNDWERLYNYPEYGISFFYSTLGNDDIFGRELAINPFFRIYFPSQGKLHLFTHAGLGFGYVNRKFDLEDNYLNVAIGSNYNLHFVLKFGAKYDLPDRFSLNAGLSFDHFSNGNTSEPNLGINYLTGFVGMNYRLGLKTDRITQAIKPHAPKNNSFVFASIGGKYTRQLLSNYYMTSSLSYEWSRSFTRILHLGAGADVFWDSSVKSSLNSISEEYQGSDSFQSGVHLSLSVVYDRFSLGLQQGVYLLLLEQVNDYRLYNRGVLQYQLTDHLAMRLSMKSHLHILDYPEIGIGYRF